MKQKLTVLKEEIKSSTVIVVDFNMLFLTTVENSMAVSHKIKIELSYNQQFHCQGYT